MPKLQSKLHEKLFSLLIEYNDKIFKALCIEDFKQVQCCYEAKKVIDEIIKVCQDRGRF